jgi:hypothetical protein
MDREYELDAEHVYSHGVDVREEELRSLLDMPRLVGLNLNTTHTTDAMLEIIGGLSTLEDLDLSLTDITDAGLVHLHGIRHLKHLRIKENRLTDRGIFQLLPHVELETLNLKALDIGNLSLEYLERLPRLERVVFSHPKFDQPALAKLQCALPSCELIVDGRVFDLASVKV